VLADPPGERDPQGRSREARDEIDEQQQARLPRREAEPVLEIEKEHGAGDSGRCAGHHVEQDEAHEQRIPDQRLQLRQLGMGAVSGALALLDRRGHDENGERRQQDDEPAHGMDAASRTAADQRRQRQDEDHSEHLRRHPPGEDPGALVIILGKGRAPAELRDHRHRITEIHQHQEGEGGEGGDARPRHEDEPDSRGEDEAAGQQPRPVAPEPGPGAVHPVAEQRIERQVDGPDEEEDEADGGEVEAERSGIIRRQIDDHRQPDRADRQAGPGEGRQC
jgi:hypothetical protein